MDMCSALTMSARLVSATTTVFRSVVKVSAFMLERTAQHWPIGQPHLASMPILLHVRHNLWVTVIST